MRSLAKGRLVFLSQVNLQVCPHTFSITLLKEKRLLSFRRKPLYTSTQKEPPARPVMANTSVQEAEKTPLALRRQCTNW